MNSLLALLITTLSFIMIHAQESFSNSTKVISEEITLETEEGTVYGTLTLPEEATPVPIILFIAGSGPTDRDGNTMLLSGKNNSLKILADSLAQYGCASLRYDKRGVAASKEAVQSEDSLRFEDYVDDAVGWIEQLRQDERFSKVVVFGHSEGSLIGMLAAKEASTTAYISVSGIAQSADSLILEQLANQLEFVKNEAYNIISSLQQGQTEDSVSQAMLSLFRPSVQPYLISWFKYQPAEVIQELTQPVLIIQGTTDLQVKVKEAERLAKAQPNAKLEIINGMNHVLKDAPAEPQANLAAYSNPALPLAEGLVESITSFLANNIQ